MGCAERPDDFEKRRGKLKDMSDEELHQYFWQLVEKIVKPLIEEALAAAKCKLARARYAGRNAAASPATGLASRHASEQAALVADALGLSVRGEIRRRRSR